MARSCNFKLVIASIGCVYAIGFSAGYDGQPVMPLEQLTEKELGCQIVEISFLKKMGCDYNFVLLYELFLIF